MSNININPSDDFDLFATEVEDNLQEQIAKGTYKWTNKYTAILGALVVITASVSGGIWYGNSHAASATTNALSNFASRVRGAAAGGAFTGGAFTGAAGATGSGASAFAGAGAAGGTSGFGGGGFGGGSRLSGTIAKVNGNTVTITLDAAPSTPIAAGDAVSVRDTGAAGSAGAGFGAGAATSGAPSGAAAGGTAPTGTKRTRGTTATGGTTSGTAPATGATSGQPSVGGGAAGGNGGAGGGNGGAGGGRFNNPAFTACLAKNGVTLAPGARPDRTDPKVAAALQACFSTLGGGAPGAGGGGFGGGNGGGARPAPTATP